MKPSSVPSSIEERWTAVIWACAALLLIFVGSFLNLLRFGDYPRLAPETIWAAGYLALPAIFIGVLSGIGRPAMWIVSGLAAYFAVLFNAPDFWPILWGVGTGIVASRKGLMPLKFLVVIFSVVTVSSITLPSPSHLAASGEKRPNGSGRPLVYIILDETGGQTELDDMRVWRSAWARHTSSRESIAEIYEGHFDALRAAGYSTEFWLADWTDACEDYCLTYNQFSVSAVRELPDRNARIAGLLGGFRSLIPDGNWIETFWPRSIDTYLAIPINSVAILDAFSERVGRLQKGEALFLHVIFPHDPYIIDENCNLLPRTEWGSRLGSGSVDQWKAQHARQFRCAEKKVRSIMENNADAIFIIHGDHGDRIFDYRTADIGSEKTMLESFFAIRVPGEKPREYNNKVYLGDLMRSFAASNFKTIDTPEEAPN